MKKRCLCLKCALAHCIPLWTTLVGGLLAMYEFVPHTQHFLH